MPIPRDFNEEERFSIEKYNRFPLHFKGLHFVALGGVATSGQLQRWLQIHEPNPKRCFETITHLIGRGYIRKLAPAQLKTIKLSDNGKLRAGKYDVIFYLTVKGYSELKRHSIPRKNVETQADRIVDSAKFGNPAGVKLYRVLHELVLAESVLHWLEHYDFVWFKSENQMKSEFYTLYEKKRRAFKTSELPAHRAYADYELHMLDKVSGEFQTVECEVSIRMNDRQIDDKPSHFYWFCHSQKKADQIKRVTGGGAEVLNDIFSPLWVQEELISEYYLKNTKFEQQKRVLEQIKELGGVASTTALAEYGTKTKDYYRGKLEELHLWGWFRRQLRVWFPVVLAAETRAITLATRTTICKWMRKS